MIVNSPLSQNRIIKNNFKKGIAKSEKMCYNSKAVKIKGYSSVGRTPVSKTGCPGFESLRPCHQKKVRISVPFFIFHLTHKNSYDIIKWPSPWKWEALGTHRSDGEERLAFSVDFSKTTPFGSGFLFYSGFL